MDKLRFMRLWDLYRNLLTPTQREMTDMYFNLDLTVSEIAEQKGVSRQAVSECLTGCKKQLAEYEDKLGFDKQLGGASLHLSFLMTDISKWADGFFAAHPEYASEAEKLEKILNNDYGEEIKIFLDNK